MKELIHSILLIYKQIFAPKENANLQKLIHIYNFY
jgi:hypothetical protein